MQSTLKRRRLHRSAMATALGFCLSLPGAGFAQEMQMKGPAEKSAPSAKSKLDELKKARKKAEVAAPAPAKATKNADGVYPWATSDDVSYIDEMLAEEHKYLGFPVAGLASEGEFQRRVSLDLIGRIPTYDEILEYQKDHSPKRRENLVNRLLASEDFGRNFSIIWTRLLLPPYGLLNEEGNNKEIDRDGLTAWLQKEFNRNSPWNDITTKLLTATGRWDENGAVNYIIANVDRTKSSDATSFTSKLFLGIQLQCTECHAHPWNEWKQEHFHGLNAFFLGTREARATVITTEGQPATDYYELDEIPYQELKEKGTSFEMRNGLLVYLSPKYLDGRDANDILRGAKARKPGSKLAALDGFGGNLDFLNEDDVKTGSDEPIYLRQILAKVITAEDNPYFARAMVNRMWYHCLGHSFIKNVDDFDNGQDEPSMPDLLDRLAADFKSNGHDLKRLLRWITTSKAYALSTQRKGNSAESIGFFTFQLAKPMTPEQLYDSVLALTRFDKGSTTADAAAERRRFLRELTTTFATDAMTTSTPSYDGTISQALMMMNSRLIVEATSGRPGTFLHSIASNAALSLDDKVDAIYMAALCRKPTGAEKAQIAQLFNSAGMVCPVKGVPARADLSLKYNGRAVHFCCPGCMEQFKKDPARFAANSDIAPLQDVMWAILNSSEFLINH